MKKSIIFCLIAILFVNLSFSQKRKAHKEEFEDVIWHVKAFRPDLKFLKIKAIDKKGNIYDVKAIQNSKQTSLLDVKAFVRGKKLPIKMLVDKRKYYPVKAIDELGNLLDIKAITEDGKHLPVKGVSQSGNIVHIRAIYENKIFYDVIAISPDGKTNAVKGIKMNSAIAETTISGIEVYAHIKSIPQVAD
ncbi:hypothetical protein [uncultured Algibacter sp.]|uniref:DUF7486 family protein n=1 Tax=uncultured Algibacter sp. TaxID=298659 RepID=UPI0026156F7E|nr:hypothetical protein [uncultured Algibacter sp.]